MKKRDVWNFEKDLAIRNPKVWINEANNLKYSAKILISCSDEVINCILNKQIQPRFPVFFTARIIRMLFSFSLENLVKRLLIKQNSNKYFNKEGNINFGRKAHDLVRLFTEAQIKLNDEEKMYLEIWTKCAIFAGRYPIAKNEHDFPNQKMPTTRKKLIKQEEKRFKKQIKEGKASLPEINDTIHQGVGGKEEQIFDKLFDILITTFSETQVDATLSDFKESSPTHNKR
ncbi:hypothetical protein ACFLZF_00555 [Nanoarchaeota archaeon]